MRQDNRKNDEKRNVTLELDVNMHAEGSVLVSFGNTKVICTASVDDRAPIWMRGEGKGWVTAEYQMLPRATSSRNSREASRGKLTGRTMEIQRLVGRSLRSVVDLSKLGERSIIIDCDVIQADGGTRTASITGGFVALKLAIQKLMKDKVISTNPIKEHIAAISVGVIKEDVLLDLNYIEDSSASVDMNVVMTEAGQFVEVQGTGEESTFSHEEMLKMIDYAKKGIDELIDLQKAALGEKDEDSNHRNQE